MNILKNILKNINTKHQSKICCNLEIDRGLRRLGKITDKAIACTTDDKELKKLKDLRHAINYMSPGYESYGN